MEDVNNESFLMYDCTTKKMKDLKIGDVLMGADSKPCTILNIQKVAEKNYLVIPVKGNSYIVGQSHTLAINLSSELRYKIKENGNIEIVWFNNYELKYNNKIFNINKYDKSKEKTYKAAIEFINGLKITKRFGILVNKYLKTNGQFKHCAKGYKVALNFPEVPLKIDPYIIGAWLGDGTSRDPNITTVDPEIVEYFTNYFSGFKLKVERIGNGISFGITSIDDGGKRINPFRTFLKETKLKNNKHIPIEYLRNSKENRLKLLAGLLDTDGSLSNNCFDFVQKREILFDQFIFLSRSLGFSCYKTECEKSCTNSLNDHIGIYFRTCVSGKGLEEIPTLLERKKANPREQIKDALVTGIHLKEIDSFPSYRIITDTPLFLMEDLTVRHSWIPTLKII